MATVATVLNFRPLTERQSAVLAFIAEFTKRNGYAPAVRDICDQFDLTPNGVVGHLNALRKKGYVDWTPNRARTLRILKPARR